MQVETLKNTTLNTLTNFYLNSNLDLEELPQDLKNILMWIVEDVYENLADLDALYSEEQTNKIVKSITSKYANSIISYANDVMLMCKKEVYKLEEFTDYNENINEVGFSGYDANNQLGQFQNVRTTNKSKNWLTYIEFFYEKYPSNMLIKFRNEIISTICCLYY